MNIREKETSQNNKLIAIIILGIKFTQINHPLPIGLILLIKKGDLGRPYRRWKDQFI